MKFYLKSDENFILFSEIDTSTYMNRLYVMLKTSARIVHSACDNVDRFVFTRLALSQLRKMTVFKEIFRHGIKIQKSKKSVFSSIFRPSLIYVNFYCIEFSAITYSCDELSFSKLAREHIKIDLQRTH